MLIIDKENHERYFDTIRLMERELPTFFLSYLSGKPEKEIRGHYHLMDQTQVELANQMKDESIQNFKIALSDLNMYGDDPRRIRVYIRFDTRDWTMHSVNYWRAKESCPTSQAGMPIGDDSNWRYMFNGGLVFSKHDRTWSVHT